MRQYQCNKIVEAGQIEDISYNSNSYYELYLAGDESIFVPVHWFMKHGPEPGGYFIRYRDGYESYSPADPFEEGYDEVN